MFSLLKCSIGQKFGSWELIEFLGKGGNAEVWSAARNDGTIAALKILNAINPYSEPYQRFKTEVDFLRSLGEQPGVLPIIEASLPQQPSKKNRAWLAMPIATPISDALGDAPDIITVIESAAAIAETLAMLAEKRISHRDIKPGNLYCFDGKWTIGDFGLVEYPNKDALTADGKTLGPLYFMAPEMISNPKDAEGYPADVYSLAKTLWVLATGQKYPPQGEQRVDTPQVTLSHYISHSRIRMLDRLIENATKYTPQDRPTMADLASELRAWLTPVAKPASLLDVSDLIERIGVAVEPASRADKRKQQNIEQAHEYLERFRSALEQIAPMIARTGCSDGVITEGHYIFIGHSSRYNFEFNKKTGRALGTYIDFMEGFGIKAKGPGRDPYEMIAGAKVYLFEDEMLEFVTGYDFRVLQLPTGLTDYRALCSDYAPIGSAKLEQCISRLIDSMFKYLRPSLEYFARLLESQRL